MKRSLLVLALFVLGVGSVSARPHWLPRFVYVAPCRPCPCYVVPVPSAPAVTVESPACPNCPPAAKPAAKFCACTNCDCCGGCSHCGVKAELLPPPKAK
jgi:hypothetical protein